MIPKIIHYCWFGGNEKPQLAKRCIESWKRYLPDYKIVEWNETNFDISSNSYCEEAYKAKKWAFVTDYVRLYALFNYGGIYMDTDVEVLKPLDPFLSEEAFSGFETKTSVPTGIMASEKKQPFFGKLLSEYTDKHFFREDGTMDLTTNVTLITNACIKAGLSLNGKKQTVEGFTLYPAEYFCPKDVKTHKLKITSQTYTIHHFDGSWLSKKSKFKNRVTNFLGPNITNILVNIKRLVHKKRK
ncbi:glycosyl transferase [Drancourtella massiliensis]|uniref:Glycosyl transferase n=1 Tax=Drancourtella massiliensis TaxID=1632013 RepID=A0ABS2EJ45_9FIRM|nr:glycosyltransferase [Drancourtella massiliensis]MBM6745004.1 glycosyl transferase [Drancourtella massiliensis]